ncbi:MAG: hemin ABC transporter substrate-binding protein, partial [Acetobacteraceae bacterium]
AERAADITVPKRVLFILSLQGGAVMAGGEGSEAEGIIRLAGGINAASGFQGYKPMTDEAVLAAQPDVILMMDREGDLSISDADVLTQPALSQTPAAAAGAIVRMDGMLLLGFGPRTPEAAQALHAALYGSGS